MRKNVNDWERILSVAAGAGLVAFALAQPRRRAGLALAGAGLVGRGLGGRCPVNAAIGRTRRRDDTRRALGGPRGIHLNGRVVIRRPAEQLFAFWRNLSNLPRFMPHLKRIDVTDDTHSRWVVRGPAGTSVAWDAEIINAEYPQLIGWRSLAGADVASAGSVSFHQISPAETEVDVKMQYDPPAGKAGAAFAWLAGQAPSSMLQRDLGRLKVLIENNPSLA
jgi:uncharacterized membrane protein